jgi:sulfhydrogenase subunit alpha
MSQQRSIDIKVPVLARVEGEGALEIAIRDGHIEQLCLRIYEPPRFFEKFLEGRSYRDVPDMVARICGICPVAYQMSAVHAIESIFACDPGPWVREMRRLFYCGEWIESHALHIHLLAAPDFLGFDSGITMAARYPDEVRRGLYLQGLGNKLLRLLGARSIHPVGARVGGFWQAPSPEAVAELLAEFRAALPQVEALVAWIATIPLPEDDQAFVSVALRHEQEYPFNEGRLVSDQGLDIAIDSFAEHFVEFHQPHSNALHAHLNGRPYLVGPLARLNLNRDRLPAATQALIAAHAPIFPSRNMFHSIVARAIELHFAFVEAIRILAAYQMPTAAAVAVTPRAGVGYGCTEAPRGILWHRYELDGEGRVVSATITPPTSQNLARVEEDLRLSLERLGLDQAEEVLRLHGEKVVRNYDPCISCATHFLTLKMTAHD